MFWRSVYKRKGILSRMGGGSEGWREGEGKLATECADTGTHVTFNNTVYNCICQSASQEELDWRFGFENEMKQLIGGTRN